MIFPTVSFAAETSSDTMILEWKTYKVWKDGENLSGGDLWAAGYKGM